MNDHMPVGPPWSGTEEEPEEALFPLDPPTPADVTSLYRTTMIVGVDGPDRHRSYLYRAQVRAGSVHGAWHAAGEKLGRIAEQNSWDSYTILDRGAALKMPGTDR